MSTKECASQSAGVVSAAKPHPKTAFAKPGSHQTAITSSVAVVPTDVAAPLVSHELDFSDQDTDEDAAT